jgi:hypothetical protein
MVGGLSFLTPSGALIALAVIVPVAAFARVAAKAARGRAILHLDRPAESNYLALPTVVAVPLLLALAAAGPAIRTHSARHVRTDAQAMFVFDISRSMLASSDLGTPTRLAQASALAIRLRNSTLAPIPSGVSTVTTLLLPHLFPTADAGTFDSTVRDTVSVEQPPPPFLAPGSPGTSYSALAPLRDQGYFGPQSTKRLAIFFTDGESGPYDPAALAQALVQPGYIDTNVGQPEAKPEPPISLFIIRVGSRADRVYHRNGTTEAAFRPDRQAPEIVSALAAATHGHVYTGSQLTSASRDIRSFLGDGESTRHGLQTRTLLLAPYIVLAALVPLASVIWKRNVVRD